MGEGLDAGAALGGIATLPALRVAITAREGALDVVALRPGQALPVGAACAVLVPLSDADCQQLSLLVAACRR
jgi:hypothetical protein